MARRFLLGYLLASVHVARTSPVDMVLEARQLTTSIDNWVTRACTEPSRSCFRSPWTTRAECTTNDRLVYQKSAMTSPKFPEDKPSGFDPLSWCTDFLAQTDYVATLSTTAYLTSTRTTHPAVYTTTTNVDLGTPTLTIYCPRPSPSMECRGFDMLSYDIEQPGGLKCAKQCEPVIIDPNDINPSDPTMCHQECLKSPNCKSWTWDTIAPFLGYNRCRLFTESLGVNGTNIMDPHSNSGGSQFYDRNCFVAVPSQCSQPVAKVQPPRMVITAAPAVTDASKMTKVAVKQDVDKRDPPEIDVPLYLLRIAYPGGTRDLTNACSCLITSARPPVSGTKTLKFSTYNETRIITSTITETISLSTTPHETTLVRTVD